MGASFFLPGRPVTTESLWLLLSVPNSFNLDSLLLAFFIHTFVFTY